MNQYSIESLEKQFSENFNSPLFSVLAEEYFKIKEYNKCKKVLEIGLLLNPDNNDGKFILSKIELLKNNIEIAQNILNNIIKSDPLYLNAIKLQIEINHAMNRGTKNLEMHLSSIIGGHQKDKKVSKPKKKNKPPTKIKASKKAHVKLSKVKRVSVNKRRPTIKKVKSVNVASKMKTLTMVKILINQGHYNQSASMLDALLANGTIKKSKFNEIKASINKLKSKQKK